ncbi:MAG TPA: hypothetical protein VFI73_14275 [Candidatus Nitrosopolaris sp.]|nr:hypothetical protein [Candidatus Nitrosopolaris sp.]
MPYRNKDRKHHHGISSISASVIIDHDKLQIGHERASPSQFASIQHTLAYA